MQVIIIGTKRAEICPIRRRNQDKQLFARKSQLYRIFPEDLIRCEIVKYGEHYGFDEVIAYEENQTVPFNPRCANYGKKEYFALIRVLKVRERNTGKILAKVRKIPVGMIIAAACAIIVIAAVLTQGAPIL